MWEREKPKSLAEQAKFFGDVLKNVTLKLPVDVTDAPIFFEGVDKLFASFSIPAQLQARLLLPHLIERAKSLLWRLEAAKEHYDEVNKILLHEFKLTPLEFKNRFDRAVPSSDESYTIFCSQFKNLLTYYSQSHAVGNSFDKLFSLRVADRIRSALSEACLNHILTMKDDK
jgi:hypothetical protein